MKNPYKTYAGFGLRVYHAKRAIMKLSCDRTANIYTRGFDNCFEHYDGNAVVFALMYEAKNGNEALYQGIRNMGEGLLEDWQLVYSDGVNRQENLELPL